MEDVASFALFGQTSLINIRLPCFKFVRATFFIQNFFFLCITSDKRNPVFYYNPGGRKWETSVYVHESISRKV